MDPYYGVKPETSHEITESCLNVFVNNNFFFAIKEMCARHYCLYLSQSGIFLFLTFSKFVATLQALKSTA